MNPVPECTAEERQVIVRRDRNVAEIDHIGIYLSSREHCGWPNTAKALPPAGMTPGWLMLPPDAPSRREGVDPGLEGP